jgi:competence protein ComGC
MKKHGFTIVELFVIIAIIAMLIAIAAPAINRIREIVSDEVITVEINIEEVEEAREKIKETKEIEVKEIEKIETKEKEVVFIKSPSNEWRRAEDIDGLEVKEPVLIKLDDSKIVIGFITYDRQWKLNLNVDKYRYGQTIPNVAEWKKLDLE